MEKEIEGILSGLELSCVNCNGEYIVEGIDKNSIEEAKQKLLALIEAEKKKERERVINDANICIIANITPLGEQLGHNTGTVLLNKLTELKGEK
jgi:hypothetical protein